MPRSARKTVQGHVTLRARVQSRCSQRCTAAVVVALLLGQGVSGVEVIHGDFAVESSCGSGWRCAGSAVWIGPDSPSCIDAPNDLLCNPLESSDGLLLLTPDQGGQLGAAYYWEPIIWSDFYLVLEFELTGGGGSPADGMAVVIVGTEGVPDLGHGGGGLGATGLGSVPTMIFEIDNYSNGGPDRDNNNHIGFAYSSTGFPEGDQLPSLGFGAVEVPLNGSGRFLLECEVVDRMVMCDLTNEAAGLPTTRLFEVLVEDFEPIDGFLGITGSTGGQAQAHIVHSIFVESSASGKCMRSAATVQRKLRPASGLFVEDRPVFQSGDDVDVSLSVVSLRREIPPCARPSELEIREVPPAGWVPRDVSDDGVFNPTEGAILWTLAESVLIEGKELSYVVTAPDGAKDSVVFDGSALEPGSDTGTDIRGERVLRRETVGSPFDPCGGIRLWNVLGAYSRTGGADPGEDVLRADYMTDGTDTEKTFNWFPGAWIDTEFGGAARSTTLVADAAGRNSGGVPTVSGWGDPDGKINTEDVFRSGIDDAMLYAQTYVVNTTGDDREVYLGASSDDSIQILLNGEEIWINNSARPGSDACNPQDRSPDGVRFTDPLLLRDGENSLIVKVFEGGGGWEFAVRFQDSAGNPVTDGLEIRLWPGGDGSPPSKPKFRRGDSNADGEINITDGIFTLGFLFLGGPEPSCLESANSNDDGEVNITDTIYSLNYLFLGGEEPPSPGPSCGVDPVGSMSELGCDSYPGC